MWRRGAAAAAAKFGGPSMDINFARTPTRMSCGELRSCHVGALVELAGSVQQQRMNRFFLLRDAYGATQLVVPDDSMTTGKIEVSVQDLVMVRVNRDIKKTSRGTIDFVRNMSTYSDGKSLTSEEYQKCGDSEGLLWMFRNRTDTCSGLSISESERNVTLIGWIQTQHLPRFIKLKDGYGIVQCLLPASKTELQDIAQNATADEIVQIKGKIMARPQSHINLLEENGDIEILVESIITLDPNTPPPLNLTEQNNTSMDHTIEKETGINAYSLRTHTCGELRPEHVGTQVTLCGWLQFCRMERFLILRDSYGVTQCIIPDEEVKKWKTNEIPLESILEIKGIVGNRPPSSINSELSTGAVEVLVSSLKLLNPATFSPLSIRSYNKPKEDLRLKHRYMYLRYPEMQHNLRTRSNMMMKMRKFLIDDNFFVEVETPTLFCKTPGGAQEFVVPTRHKGLFYSLIQSPQQHKQMLMAGGIDRYFQIARCYRDESTRGDRQPEFTQLDIEMSFAGREEILALVENLFKYFWPHALPSKPFPRLSYKEALSVYGSDKPDISYDFKLQNITDILETNPNIKRSNDDFGAYAIVVNESNLKITNALKKNFQMLNVKYFNVKLIVSNVQTSVDKWCDSIDVLGRDIMQSVKERLDLNVGDCLFLAYGDTERSCWCLGDVRQKIAQEAKSKGTLVYNKENNTPLWVLDFPLFTKGNDGSLKTCHHPFTAPNPEDVHLLDTAPLKVRSLAYDLVLMGNEVGGGSVRAHNGPQQVKLLKMLKISPEPLRHLINALESGCPPHAGIALGIDRIVALACNTETIRDVIAFPKSHEGCDPLTGAPAELTDDDKEFYHIRVSDSEFLNAKRLHTAI